MEKAEKIWINGKLINWDDAKVHVMAHAMNYGTGVFEGIRVYQTPKGSAVFRLREHMTRLLDGCRVMGIDPEIEGKIYGLEDMIDAVKATVKANKKVDYIKPCVFLSGERAGLNPIGVPVSFSITCIFMGPYLSGVSAEEGAKVMTSSWHRPDNLCGPAGAKVNGAYVTSCLAKREAVRQGADEAIMLNSTGHVAECTGENIFICKNGKIYTPQTSECILDGITRNSVIEIARDMGYDITETQITRTQLVSADEIWMTGTAAEVVPVTSVDGRTIGSGKTGETTKKVYKKFQEIVTGKDPKYERWLEYIN
ncbi:MAG: branched-chain amino acid transaminase [Candidatus Methanoplasma sp.]|jgi:branched-chain amino acid aminotransferase|nr:branched-chain amino acid transaminase [Candidatus Methanoplasma sp.]